MTFTVQLIDWRAPPDPPPVDSDPGQLTLASTNGPPGAVWVKAPDGIHVEGLKRGSSQLTAGAVKGELWVAFCHAGIPDGTILIGI